MTEFVKYGIQILFKDFIAQDVDDCLERLRSQPQLYLQSSKPDRKRMECRALYLAALTVKSSAIWSAKALHGGTFSMSTQRIFFERRLRKDPDEWGMSAKSCLARALSGYSIGSDSVCIDRHLERIKAAPKDAVEQWRIWFGVYEKLYGPGDAKGCVLWHIDVLDWVALKREKPVAWK